MAKRDEVEEFLRRAAARRAAAQGQQGRRPPPQQPPPQPAWAPPAPPQPFQQRPPQPPPRRPGSLAEVVMLEPVELVDAEIVEAQPAGRGAVDRSVNQHFRGTQAIGQHAQQLGADVDLADDKLEAHLHQVFDHKVGDLKRSTMEAAAESPSQAARDAPLPGAASIAAMLINPQSLRNAILMSEILRRPEENW
ncbi:MAG: hypothetical protein MUF06_17505 [Pirellulaceae bacterium]|nr:hypothetical protein [Pirellulaceae bacterium]